MKEKYYCVFANGKVTTWHQYASRSEAWKQKAGKFGIYHAYNAKQAYLYVFGK